MFYTCHSLLLCNIVSGLPHILRRCLSLPAILIVLSDLFSILCHFCRETHNYFLSTSSKYLSLPPVTILHKAKQTIVSNTVTGAVKSRVGTADKKYKTIEDEQEYHRRIELKETMQCTHNYPW